MLQDEHEGAQSDTRQRAESKQAVKTFADTLVLRH